MRSFLWNESDNAAEFYRNEGYVVFNNNVDSYLGATQDIFSLFQDEDLTTSKGQAFLNDEVVPRHKIDLIRNYTSVKNLYKDYLNVLIEKFSKNIDLHGDLYFTHCKLSFKIPNKKVNWFPHQDIGYKSQNDIRDGFAIFLALEDMDAKNGSLEIYEGSHLVGRINHDRQTENIDLGDGQMEIEDLSRFKKVPLELKRGDVVIFSQFMVHSSGISTTKSKRLAIISEIEEMQSPMKLDDYGKPPIFLNGKSTSWLSNFRISLKSGLSVTKYWFIVRDVKFLNKLARQLVNLVKKR